MFQICFGLYLGGEILAHRPHVGGGIFHTEFIQICTMFVVDFDRKHHIHLILLVFQTKFVSTGSAKSKTLTQPY